MNCFAACGAPNPGNKSTSRNFGCAAIKSAVASRIASARS